MPSFWNAQVMSKDWLSIIDDTIGWAHAGYDTLQIVLDGLIANWHGDVTALSDILWWEPLSPSYVIPECSWESCTEIFYDVTPDPTETITGFYLDWNKYEFNWWWTAEWVTTTQPSNPVAGSTYYDTTNNVIKVYNWTSWEEVGWGNVIAMTQSEYDALPAATKNDGKLRIITDAPTLDIVDDTAFGASWDWDTDTAPSKNAVYDAIWNIETLLAAI